MHVVLRKNARIHDKQPLINIVRYVLKKPFDVVRHFSVETIEPGGGYDAHKHRDIDILTYVYEGTLTHRDSLSNNVALSAGSIQHAVAGSGITHSETNEREEPVKLVHIWLEPTSMTKRPTYARTTFTKRERLNAPLRAVVNHPMPGRIQIEQSLNAHILDAEAGANITRRADATSTFLFVLLDGEVTINGERLLALDALMTDDTLEIETTHDSRAFILEHFTRRKED